MLKRPRAPSRSPTRPDPSSPPALDSSAHLPIHALKRRRTVAPILDSYERRGSHGWYSDDGEDDYEQDDWEEKAEAETDGGTHDKVYEHVNHVLCGLHTEQQHRSRAQATHSESQLQPLGPHGYRDYEFPASSPFKYDQLGCTPHAAPYREPVESQESEDAIERDHFGALGRDSVSRKGDIPAMQDDERLRVTQRYEDTNRLLGSLVLSRRRRLGTPPLDVE